MSDNNNQGFTPEINQEYEAAAQAVQNAAGTAEAAVENAAETAENVSQGFQSAAESFQMPEPPAAPLPPQPEPVYQQPVQEQPQQYTPPQYTPPQYTAPQYTAAQQQPQQQAPQYQAPVYGQQPIPAQQQKVYYDTAPAGYQQKSRIAAGLLAIMLGSLGIHNFYLENKTRAIIQLVVSLAGGVITCGMATIAMEIWGIIEGVLILQGTNPERNYDGNGVILKD